MGKLAKILSPLVAVLAIAAAVFSFLIYKDLKPYQARAAKMAKGLSETAQIARRVVVQATVPRPDGSEEMLFSSASGRWSEDASTWIGESGLSPFLLEMPIEVPAACTVDVKIHFRWYSASGYLYIDPGITIE